MCQVLNIESMLMLPVVHLGSVLAEISGVGVDLRGATGSTVARHLLLAGGCEVKVFSWGLVAYTLQ